MKRRTFLQSLGAAALTPVLPLPAFAKLAPKAVASVSTGVDAATYQWAEVIVRAHNKSSIAMLQRLLKLDASEAVAIQNQLVTRGVLIPQANDLGIRTAVNPFTEADYLRPQHKASTEILEKKAELEYADTSIEDDEEALRTMIAAVEAEIAINPNYLTTA